MTKSVTLIFLSGLVLSFYSCVGSAKDILPQFKAGQDHFAKQINSVIEVNEVLIRTSKNESTGERTSRNIDIILTNALVKSYTQNKLDSLSRNLGTITKNNITNINNYDWVNIIYLTDDGSPISDSTDHQTYVYRPTEL